MAELGKILYIVVMDECEKKEKSKESFPYTRSVLQTTLQLMGCKARHAFKISLRVFEITRSESTTDTMLHAGMVTSGLDTPKGDSGKKDGHCGSIYLDKADASNHLFSGKDDKIKGVLFELYKRRTTAFLWREKFLDIVCDALTEYKYVGPNQRADLVLACRKLCSMNQ